MRYLLFFIPLLFGSSLLAQKNSFKNPDEIIIGDRQRPKVLLMGTWHFAYPGLDAHKTKEEDKINIFTPKRQQELQELLDYIAQFKPTKIVIENGHNTSYTMDHYRRWKKGEVELRANEIHQVGLRLMDKMGLDTLYGCDAGSLLGELYYTRDTTKESYIEYITERHYFGGDDEISKRFTAWYTHQDEVAADHTLLENFLYLNQEKVMDRNFGAYIAGGQFDSEDFEGPDALSTLWFNRNLRIFRLIQTIEQTEEDRILVLFGAGHMGILNLLFRCTPEYELVDFGGLDEFSIR